MSVGIARQVVARGEDAERVAREIVEHLRAPDLRCALVFADSRLDPAVIARVTQRGLRPAPVIGCTTIGIVGGAVDGDGVAAIGLGLYGEWLRVGIGVAPELPKSPLTRSRDAVNQAAAGLHSTAAALDPSRHLAMTLFDGTCGHEEAFCIGSAAAAPQIRFVGGAAGSEERTARPFVFVRGEIASAAGIVILLESDLPFAPMTSTHLVPTDKRVVVTATTGRTIDELDGRPAVSRLRELLAALNGPELRAEHPTEYAFARYIDNVPYVRSMTQLEGERIHLAHGAEVGHVLRIVRPDDMIATTRRDLAAAAERLGSLAVVVAFSCLGRHWEAEARGWTRDLAQVYAAYPTVGFQSFGEQAGMVLVNHTLTGLAIGGGAR